jgi:hypothetical protein
VQTSTRAPTTSPSPAAPTASTPTAEVVTPASPLFSQGYLREQIASIREANEAGIPHQDPYENTQAVLVQNLLLVRDVAHTVGGIAQLEQLVGTLKNAQL